MLGLYKDGDEIPMQYSLVKLVGIQSVQDREGHSVAFCYQDGPQYSPNLP